MRILFLGVLVVFLSSCGQSPAFTINSEEADKHYKTCMSYLKYSVDKVAVVETDNPSDEEKADTKEWLETSKISSDDLNRFEYNCMMTAERLSGKICVANCGNDSDAINAIKTIINDNASRGTN